MGRSETDDQRDRKTFVATSCREREEGCEIVGAAGERRGTKKR